jgi:Sulfotransferase family
VEDQVDAHEMSHYEAMLPVPRYALHMALFGDSAFLKRRFEAYLHSLARLYWAIHSFTGGDVIVDVSKNPVHGFMLRMIPSVELYVVHLARDPRGVIYSRFRNPRWLPFHPMKNALRWNIQNLATESLLKREQGRYLRLRYEDFIDHPPETIRRILDFVQEKSQLIPFVSAGQVNLGVCHNVHGNPNRFQTGVIDLRLDDGWILGMRRRDQRVISILTWPWLIRYRYPVWPHPARSE